MSKPDLRTVSKACSPCVNKFLVMKLHFPFYNCHYFISQNVKLLILYSRCGKHSFPVYFPHLSCKIYISTSLDFIFPSQHLWDFQIQEQFLFPLKSYVHFENWLWGISYHSPKQQFKVINFVGSERKDCVNGWPLFFFTFSSGLFEGNLFGSEPRNHKKKSNLKYVLKIFSRSLTKKIQIKMVLFHFVFTCFHFHHFNLVIKPAKITENAGISKF